MTGAFSRRRTGMQNPVKLIELPSLPKKGDVSDWLDGGHTIVELTELVARAQPNRPGIDPLLPPDWEERSFRSYWRDDVRDRRERQEQERGKIYLQALAANHKLLLILYSEYGQPDQQGLALYVGVTVRRLRQMIRELQRRRYLEESEPSGDRRRKRYRPVGSNCRPLPRPQVTSRGAYLSTRQ